MITTAKFIISNTDVKKCPESKLPEYAFIGRSNVGKSSLINMITDHKNLAKISGKPGKTRLINHFLINESWYLVDLPGYGFAKISVKEKEKWAKFIKQYIKYRTNLTCLFVLLDVRLIPQKIDLSFMENLGENGVPFVMVFTKSDKLKSKELEENINVYKEKMLEKWEELPKFFVTSAKDKLGKDEIIKYIENINKII